MSFGYGVFCGVLGCYLSGMACLILLQWMGGWRPRWYLRIMKRGGGRVVQASAFQAEHTGSIPVPRSTVNQGEEHGNR